MQVVKIHVLADLHIEFSPFDVQKPDTDEAPKPDLKGGNLT